MQQLPIKIQEKNFFGYNDTLPPEDLPPGYFAKADNVLMTDDKIIKVPGSTAIAPSIAPYISDGLAVLENYNTSTKFILSVLDGATHASLYQWAGSGSFSAVSGSNVLANSTSFMFEQATNVLFGLNGTEEFDYDGTTFTHNRAGFPLGKYLVWFHNYLFVANVSGATSRLYWSKLGDPKTFGGAVSTFSINGAGVGYAVGDVLTLTGGGGVNATFSVTTISGTGGVTAVSLLTAGSGYLVTSGAATTTTGAGSAATLNILTVDSTTASNFVDINPGDGDQITGLGVIQDQLVVFKRDTIWSVTGFSGTSFTATTINTQNTNNRIIGYGAIASGSIVSTGNDIYFLSFLGDIPHIRSLKITQYATTLSGGIITHDIQNTMKNINLSAISAVQGVYDGRYIYWGLPTGSSSTPDQVIIFDTYNITKVRGVTRYPFTSRSGIYPKYFTISTISGTSKIYFSDNIDTGLVFEIDPGTYSDNDNEIAMDVITRGYTVEAGRKAKWKYLKMKFDVGNAANLRVKADIDNQGQVLQGSIYLNLPIATLDNFILDQNILMGASTDHATIHLSKLTGYMIQFEFFESSKLAQGIYEYEALGIAKPYRSQNNPIRNV